VLSMRVADLLQLDFVARHDGATPSKRGPA